MGRKQALWLIIIVAGLAALAFGLYSMGRKPAKKKSYEPALPEGVTIALEGRSRITSTREGRIDWSMLSEGLAFHHVEETVLVDRPAAWIPLEDGGTVSVYGRKGSYFSKSENIFLEDEAVIFFDNGGRREWILFGDTASYIKEEDAFYLSGLNGILRPASGDTVEITAKNGRYDAPARSMKVKNDVTCIYGDGITLKTNELDYEMESNVARTEDRVLIMGNAFELRGRGMLADLKSNKIIVKRSVRLRMAKGMKGLK